MFLGPIHLHTGSELGTGLERKGRGGLTSPLCLLYFGLAVDLRAALTEKRPYTLIFTKTVPVFYVMRTEKFSMLEMFVFHFINQMFIF